MIIEKKKRQLLTRRAAEDIGLRGTISDQAFAISEMGRLWELGHTLGEVSAATGLTETFLLNLFDCLPIPED